MTADRARELAARIVREMVAVAPAGWIRITAVFTLASTAEFAEVRFDGGLRVARARLPE